MTPKTFTAPAAWASALINRDFSGLEGAELANLQAFMEMNPECASPVSCSDFPRLERWHNQLTETLEYTYLVP